MRQPSGGNASEIESQQNQIAKRGVINPLPKPPPGRGRDLLREQDDFPLPLQTADEIDIFHERQLCISPQTFEEIPSNKKSLIAIGKGEEPRPQIRQFPDDS